MELLKSIIDNYFCIDIRKNTRDGEYVKGRQMFFHIYRKYNNTPRKKLAKFLFFNNHATVINAEKKCENFIATEGNYKFDYMAIEKKYLEASNISNYNAEMKMLKARLIQALPEYDEKFIDNFIKFTIYQNLKK